MLSFIIGLACGIMMSVVILGTDIDWPKSIMLCLIIFGLSFFGAGHFLNEGKSGDAEKQSKVEYRVDHTPGSMTQCRNFIEVSFPKMKN